MCLALGVFFGIVFVALGVGSAYCPYMAHSPQTFSYKCMGWAVAGSCWIIATIVTIGGAYIQWHP